MPVYQFSCPVHGPREVVRPMAEASLPAACACGAPMRRLYSAQAIIMRPDGWSLKPGDAGYWNFNRQGELGQIRQGTTTDRRRLDASLSERPAPPKIAYTDAQMREIRNLSEIVDRDIRASDAIPELVREGS